MNGARGVSARLLVEVEPVIEPEPALRNNLVGSLALIKVVLILMNKVAMMTLVQVGKLPLILYSVLVRSTARE